MAVKAQRDMAQLAQVLLGDVADGGDRVAQLAELQALHDLLEKSVDDREAFSWRKETIFGGLYQKVVGVKR